MLFRLRCLCTRRFVRACSLAGLVLLGEGARADVDVWSSVGPNGGNVFALAIDPHAPATIYAGTGGGAQRFNSSRGGGVFRTTNGGASWQPAGSGLPGDAVLSLAIDPVTTSTLYAGTRNHGVFEEHGRRGDLDSARGQCRVVEGLRDRRRPGDAGHALRGNGQRCPEEHRRRSDLDGDDGRPRDAALLRSCNRPGDALDPLRGDAEQRHLQERRRGRDLDGGLERPDGNECLHDRVDPKTPSTLYAGTNGSGIFKSTDGAATWKAAGRRRGDQLRHRHRSRHAHDGLCLRQRRAGR